MLAEVESGDLRNVLILTLTLLLLELEGDTTNRAALDTLHPIELKKVRLVVGVFLSFFRDQSIFVISGTREIIQVSGVSGNLIEKFFVSFDDSSVVRHR